MRKQVKSAFEKPIVLAHTQHIIPYIEDVVDENTTYIGYADWGVGEDEAKWRIIRINTVGTVTRMECPKGDNSFSFVWDDRASYTYAR